MTGTIAIFSTYAPSEGFGGPARVFHERVALEAAEHRVIHVVLQAKHERTERRPQDLVRVVERPHGVPIDHIYHDVDLGRRAAADARLVTSIIEHLRRHDTSAILLEQPFLVEVAGAAADALDIPVVYSCQNVEYRLRRDLERFHDDWRRPTTRSDQVRKLEQAAVDLAAAVTTICPSDQTAMNEEFGCDSTIVPNGSSVAEVRYGSNPSQAEVVDFLFAGSSYWPNIEGFAQIATPSLAFLPPGTKVHVAGSVSSQLLAHPRIIRHQSANASRLALHGFLPMPELVDLMRQSRAVLVPVFIGEGSNLKSADALASGSPVIMTRRATQGYESVLAEDDEGVTVVDDAAEFRAAMSDALQCARRPARVGSTRAASLTWSTRLQPLVDVVRDAMIASRPGDVSM